MLHAIALSIVMGQIKHVVPHAVNPGQGDELVFVTHGGNFFLEIGDIGIVKIFSSS